MRNFLAGVISWDLDFAALRHARKHLTDLCKSSGRPSLSILSRINNVEALARGIHATSVAVEERRDSGFSPFS
jgi:hypothetical protein